MNSSIEPRELIGKTVKLSGGELVIGGRVVHSQDDHGDCCGFAGSSIEHFADGVITDVTVDDCDEPDAARVVITVFHEDQALASLEALAGSGSGWAYGAVSRIFVGEDELLEVMF